MKKVLFIAAPLLCCTAVAFTLFTDISGKWKGTVPAFNNTPIHCVFKVDNDVLTGTVQMTSSPYDISKGKIKGDSISYLVVVDNGDAIVNKGKYYAAGDSISLDFTFMGGTSHATLTRDKDDK